jgi:hypothetical protein
VLAEEGRRDVRRRHPGRAHAVRDTRHAPLATRHARVAKPNHSRTPQPRANAQGALQPLVARAAQRRLADGGALPLEARPLTLTVHASAPHEAAQRDGCSGRKTDLTPAHVPKDMGHDRSKDLASVEQAFRTCTTAHLAVRPICFRREARTRAHALVVLLASQIMR